MSEQPSVTTREAVLASLLAHACLLIYVLLFPDTLRWSGRSPFDGVSDVPVKVEFLTQPKAATPPSASLGDAGRERRSEPRPPDAPPATNDDPYARGNTRNRFVAPPLPDRTRAAPQPGGPGADRTPAGSPPAEERRGDESDNAREGEPSASENPADSAFYVPPRGGGPGAKNSKGTTLKEALGRMSSGLSGGAPLKFDNPTGGLSGPLGGLSFDTPGFDWGPYARKIYWVIWTNWTRGWPPAAWAGIKGVVTVHFTIQRDGRITGITVLDPSGTPAFDTCATVALEASSPLPPLPENFPEESEGITARFLYNTDADAD